MDYTANLSKEATGLFNELQEKHYITDHPRLMLLRIACESWEIITTAKKVLDKEGYTITGSHGLKPHPQITNSKDAKNQLMASLKALDLETGAFEGDMI